MSGRFVIPVAQRAALHKLERSESAVTLHTSVAMTLQARGMIEQDGTITYKLTQRGRDFIAAMNNPALTVEELSRMYR